MRKLHSVIIGVLILLFATPLYAQNQHKNQARGFNANGVYSTNDLDSVNLFNGNLILRVPLGSSYRVSNSLSYSFVLFYNSALWSQIEVCQPTIDVNSPSYFPPYSAFYIDGVNFYLEDALDDSYAGSGRGWDNECFTYSVPNPSANAGMGWQLSMGKLYYPRSGVSDDRLTATEKFYYVYQTPDGSEHTFYPTLHEGEADDAAKKIWFTRDNSYLRLTVLKDASNDSIRIEFPDGTKHTFQPVKTPFGVEYKVTRMEDQYNNWVSIQYQDTNGDTFADDKWVVKDSARGSAQHEVIFQSTGGDYQKVVSEVKLLATNGQTASYKLNYENRMLERATPYAPTRPDMQDYRTAISAAFLNSIEQPDLSQYQMPVDTSYDITGSLSSKKYLGVITGMTLPTGASIEWQYSVPGMNKPEGYGYFYPFVSSARNYLRSNTGVRRRILRTNGQTYIWKYDPKPEPRPTNNHQTGELCSVSSLAQGCSPKEFVNTVTTPEGDRTVHFFSTYPHPYTNNSGRNPSDWHIVEYGLPLTKYDHGLPVVTDSLGAPLFLSQLIYKGNGTPDNPDDDTLMRSTYVRYETDRFPKSDGWGDVLETNARLSASRAIYYDDDEGGVIRYSEIQNSNYDGLGHYRRVEKLGNFDGNADDFEDSRATLTNYNPFSGEYRINPQNNTLVTGFTPVRDDQAWILDTYNQVIVRDNRSDSKSMTDFYFDAQGSLRRKRIYKNTSVANGQPSSSANDVVVEYIYTPEGNLHKEKYYGGYRQSIGLSNASTLPTLSLNPYGYEYGIQHTYAAGGALKTSQYIRPSGSSDATVSFKSVDRDIDVNTGLTLVERDTAEDPVSYQYDGLLRVTQIKPRQGSLVDLTYTRKGGTLPGGVIAARATVNVYYKPNGGGTALDEEVYEFDGRGYLVKEGKLMPRADGSSAFSYTQTTYNGSGWKTSVTELGSTLKKTEYLSFDPFGRPGVVRTADGKETAFNYYGVRRMKRTVWGVMTPSATNGVGVERNAISWEFYDVHGRLDRVREPSGIGNDLIATFYGYDEGNRLVSVYTKADVQETSGVTTSIEQKRSYEYDGVGNLLSEMMPEVGTSGNGTISYSGRNTRGQVGERVQGATTLRYTYDAVERPLLIEERKSDGSYRALKSYGYYGLYDNKPAELSYVGGKMSAAIRHNYVVDPRTGIEVDVVVTEKYEYKGLDGRLSKRRTELSLGSSFEQTFTYGPLGNLTSQTYPQCTAETIHCAPVATPRTVNYTYTKGLLTRVSSGAVNYASSISYHENGMLREVAHGNNLEDVFDRDPNFMPRVARVQVKLSPTSTPLWDSGTYLYDGGGNIYDIGSDWYFYDLAGRLVEGTSMTLRLKQSYDYDAFGNLRKITTKQNVGTANEQLRGQPQVIDTDAATNRLRGVTYDAQGNATGQPGLRVFTYDAMNMIKAVPNKVYIYGPTDERVWIYDQTSGFPVETATLRGLNGEVLREYRLNNGNTAGSWNWTKDYIYRGTTLLASEAPHGRFDYHTDHLGSPRLITNSAGTRISSHQYLPFGDEDAAQAAQDDERLKFTSHERDQNPGAFPLDYMRGRYYYYSGAKFLSIDPGRDIDLRRPQSWNSYAYVRNNPINSTDPTGRAGIPVSAITQFAQSANNMLEAAPFNPVTNLPGFISNPVGSEGHLRDPRGGQGQFGASRGGGSRTHQGLDIAGENGATPIYAAADGVVTFSGARSDKKGRSYGTYIEIDHGKGVKTRYAHNSANFVSKGQQVVKGQWIGLVGDTGNAKGLPPHVHFEVWQNGTRIDPAKWLNTP